MYIIIIYVFLIVKLLYDFVVCDVGDVIVRYGIFI